jgi:hypothetical protein
LGFSIKGSWNRKSSTLLVTILLSSLFTVPAQASTSVTIPAPANTNTSAFTNLFSNTDPNLIDGFGDTAQVLVIATATSGTLQLGGTTGLTAVVGYQSPVGNSKLLEIAFTGTQSAANAALKTLKYQGDSARTGAATLTITSSVTGGAYYSTNQHYYEFKNLALSWDAARCVAKYVYTVSGSATEIDDTTDLNDETVFTKATCEVKGGYAKTDRKFNGLKGYLATSTDANENIFINEKAGSTQAWLGGSDYENEGTWKWVDGPEAGQTFWIQGTTSTRRGTNLISTLNMFNNWNGEIEPNNSGGNEDALQILSGGTGLWNDLPHTSSILPFIIEYGGQGETLSTATATANKALTIISVPIAPTISSVTAGNTQLTLNFTAPTDNGGSTISDYEYSIDDGVNWISSGSTTSPITITGLTNATTYSVKLRAINTTGNGAAPISATNGTPVATVPGAPTITSITAGNAQLSVSFTAPTDTGTSAISDYEYSTDNGATWTLTGSTTSPIVITGLSNGTTYQVKLRAKNTSGSGNPTAATSATPTAPSSGGGSSSPAVTPTPTPTPSASVSTTPRPTPTQSANPIIQNPLAIPVEPQPGRSNNPEPLLRRLIEDIATSLRPIIINIFTQPSQAPNPSFDSIRALELATTTTDKKVVELPSLVRVNNELQSSKLVVIDNTTVQVVTETGGLLSVQSQDGVAPVPVDNTGKVQMIRANTVNTEGVGLLPNSEFAVYLFSEPTLLGVGKSDAAGKFFASFVVDKDFPLGNHTLQINGTLPDGKSSSISMPVTVIENADIARNQAMPKTILIDENPVTRATDALYLIIAIFAFLILFMLFGGSRLMLAAVRRRKDQ